MAEEVAPAEATYEEALRYCERLARSHYENFTVVSWLFPRALRPDMYAVYAYCRHSDDLGDEAAGDRLALLESWEKDLERCYGGAPEHPILVALQRTIARHGIPIEPFKDLLAAFKRDQRQQRYETLDDLLSYCRCSADPVGRLVLYLFGEARAETFALSDRTCTALQLANFWQDVRRDHAIGRVYVPLEDVRRFGCTEEQIAEGRCTEEFRALIRFECDRARAMFREGAALIPMVKPALRLDLELFTRGGLAVLDAIAAEGYDVLARRPVVGKSRKIALFVRAWARQRLGIGEAPR